MRAWSRSTVTAAPGASEFEQDVLDNACLDGTVLASVP